MFETEMFMNINTTNPLLGDPLWDEMMMVDYPISASVTTDHSYSLNSDGDSLANSPNSFNSKLTELDDDDECLPMINFNQLFSDNPMPTLPPFNYRKTKLHKRSSRNNNNNNNNVHDDDDDDVDDVDDDDDDDDDVVVGAANVNKQTLSKSLGNSNAAEELLAETNNLPHLLENDIFGRLMAATSTSTQAAAQLNDDDVAHDDDIVGGGMDLEDACCIKPEPLSRYSTRPNSPAAATFSCDNEKTTAQLNGAHLLLNAKQIAGIQIKTEASSNNSGGVVVRRTQMQTQTQALAQAQQGTTTTTSIKQHNGNGGHYGTPLTPCSLQSDEFEETNAALRAHACSSSRRDSTSSMSSTASSFKSGVHISKRRPTRTKLNVRKVHNSSHGSTRQPINTPLISSQPKNSTGPVMLTDEEVRVYKNENLPIPATFPLTKEQEKTLKGVRRKIKNKISAQESRRKKKEYVEQLEQKVNELENVDIEKSELIEELKQRVAEKSAVIDELKTRELEQMKIVNVLRQTLINAGIKIPANANLLTQRHSLNN